MYLRWERVCTCVCFCVCVVRGFHNTFMNNNRCIYLYTVSWAGECYVVLYSSMLAQWSQLFYIFFTLCFCCFFIFLSSSVLVFSTIWVCCSNSVRLVSQKCCSQSVWLCKSRCERQKNKSNKIKKKSQPYVTYTNQTNEWTIKIESIGVFVAVCCLLCTNSLVSISRVFVVSFYWYSLNNCHIQYGILQCPVFLVT